jgi:hypothetical protein
VIESEERNLEDRSEDLAVDDPGDKHPEHAVPTFPSPIEEAETSALGHKQGDHGIAIERRQRKEIECAEEQIEDE